MTRCRRPGSGGSQLALEPKVGNRKQIRRRTSSASSIMCAPTSCAPLAAASACVVAPPTSGSSLQASQTSVRPMAWGGGIEHLIEQVVRPAFVGLPPADVDLLIAARFEGVGWHAAGAALGMDRAATRRARQRILRFLSTGDALRRLMHRLDDVP
jgi:hypothetical protein